MDKKNWSPSSRENLVIMSAYNRASEQANVRTDSGGGGGASQDIPHGHPYGKLFPWRFFVLKSQKNTHFCLPCQETIVVVDLLTEAEREKERQRARINRQRCGEEVRERAGHG